MLEVMPEGWSVDKTAGSPLHGYSFVTNGKSPLNGQQRALLRVLEPQRLLFCMDSQPSSPKVIEQPQKSKPVQVVDASYVRTVNELARQRFKLRLLADIKTDLMICEIEGWIKAEYIQELKNLINGLGKPDCIVV